jgi:hypothetical protein
MRNEGARGVFPTSRRRAVAKPSSRHGATIAARQPCWQSLNHRETRHDRSPPLAALAALLALPAQAAADDDCRRMPACVGQAVAIAVIIGLLVGKEVACDDDARDVEGWHADGREMEVEVGARTGRVLEVSLDD